jgi:hypothetical protein
VVEWECRSVEAHTVDADTTARRVLSARTSERSSQHNTSAHHQASTAAWTQAALGSERAPRGTMPRVDTRTAEGSRPTHTVVLLLASARVWLPPRLFLLLHSCCWCCCESRLALSAAAGHSGGRPSAAGPDADQSSPASQHRALCVAHRRLTERVRCDERDVTHAQLGC